MSGKPDGYIDVAERIVEFREQYPTGSLQQVDVQFLDFAGKSWVVYTAAAYRTPDDERPGHGTAWEPVPGPTNFTRDSELQNAETSAWGRAIVAVLAADTKRGVASANEVRNRQQADPQTRAAQALASSPIDEAHYPTVCGLYHDGATSTSDLPADAAEKLVANLASPKALAAIQERLEVAA